MGYNAETNAGSIYRFYKGEIRRLFPNITIPNAICFPDRHHAHFADSAEGIIYRVELDKDGWPLGKPENFIDLSKEEFAPDGAVCDSEGRLWSAQWMASRVAVYSGEGKLVKTHELPTSQITCPAFGGPDLKTLFVTSAGAHLPDELKGTQPRAGFVFRIDTSSQGLAENRVIV